MKSVVRAIAVGLCLVEVTSFTGPFVPAMNSRIAVPKSQSSLQMVDGKYLPSSMGSTSYSVAFRGSMLQAV
jgi:hypothetical protein